jgi:hypothetical protein
MQWCNLTWTKAYAYGKGGNLKQQRRSAMKRIIWTMVALIMGGSTAILLAAQIAAAGAPQMTAEELRSRLGDPDVIILDVRRAAHWKASDRKIVGAVREDPNDVKSWAGKYAQEKTLVLYCA